MKTSDERWSDKLDDFESSREQLSELLYDQEVARVKKACDERDEKIRKQAREELMQELQQKEEDLKLIEYSRSYIEFLDKELNEIRIGLAQHGINEQVSGSIITLFQNIKSREATARKINQLSDKLNGKTK